MADVINSTTLQFRTSVNTQQYLSAPWVINPDMSQVAGVSPIYWKWEAGDPGRPIEMTPAEQAVVDTAILEAARDTEAGQLDSTEGVLRAMLRVNMVQRNALAVTINEIIDAIANAGTIANLKTRVGNVALASERTMAFMQGRVRNVLGT